jgi:cell wall-associated NlpC family hydrolase
MPGLREVAGVRGFRRHPGGRIAAARAKGALPVTAQIRLTLLVLSLGALLALLPGSALASGTKSQRLVRSKAFSTGAVSYAKRLVGVPYRYGGSTPRSGFDCSGFVSFVYRHFGIPLPRTSYGQFGTGRSVARAALRPGDLVFFDGVGHVGMYVGGGRFIHAPSSGKSVQVSSLSESWYRSRYVGARRLVAAPTRVVAAKATRLTAKQPLAAVARMLVRGE